jgi:hypothetical protein
VAIASWTSPAWRALPLRVAFASFLIITTMPESSDKPPYIVFGYGSLIWKVCACLPFV